MNTNTPAPAPASAPAPATAAPRNAVGPLRVYFIRHGETAWSLTGQHTGRTDLPLTPRGEEMARGLATTLRDIPFSLVLTSPRLRARSTCTLAAPGAATQVEPNLVEWDYGDYEGLSTPQIREQHPGWNLWDDGCPNGEMPADVGARADQLITRLNTLTGDVALVSHGHFGRALAARWIGLPVAQGVHFAIDPASVGILDFEVNPPHRRVIFLWNATARWSR